MVRAVDVGGMMATLAEAYAEAGVAPPKRRNQRPETLLQIRIVGWLRHGGIGPEPEWCAIEHSEKGTRWRRDDLWRRGVKGGIEDLQFLYVGHFTAIELKVGDNEQSDKQLARQARVIANGGSYFVCRTEQEVEAALRSVGIPIRIPAPLPFVEIGGTKPKRKRASKPRAERPTKSQLRVGKAFHTR
jgi:hypothetical protein